MPVPDIRLLGSPSRTAVLVTIALVEETYAVELARLTGLPRFSIQRIIDTFEKDGVLATRMVGTQRVVQLDPRYYAYAELRTLLRKIARANPRYTQALASKRSRPRRRGKPLQ